MWNPNWISEDENYNITSEKYILDGINGMLDVVDVKISKTEDVAMEITQNRREKSLKNMGANWWASMSLYTCNLELAQEWMVGKIYLKK